LLRSTRASRQRDVPLNIYFDTFSTEIIHHLVNTSIEFSPCSPAYQFPSSFNTRWKRSNPPIDIYRAPPIPPNSSFFIKEQEFPSLPYSNDLFIPFEQDKLEPFTADV
jgi:hypothetical protein